jgi:hypothetical protein
MMLVFVAGYYKPGAAHCGPDCFQIFADTRLHVVFGGQRVRSIGYFRIPFDGRSRRRCCSLHLGQNHLGFPVSSF